MRAEWINPFLQALNNTFAHLKQSWNRGAPALAHAPLQLSGVTVDIGITGDLQGKFLLSCTLPTALQLANQFGQSFGLPPSNKFGEMERSAMAEIVNMIGGTAATGFSENGLRVNISPPSLMEGDYIMATIFAAQILKIPILMENGEAGLYVAFK